MKSDYQALIRKAGEIHHEALAAFLSDLPPMRFYPCLIAEMTLEAAPGINHRDAWHAAARACHLMAQDYTKHHRQAKAKGDETLAQFYAVESRLACALSYLCEAPTRGPGATMAQVDRALQVADAQVSAYRAAAA